MSPQMHFSKYLPQDLQVQAVFNYLCIIEVDSMIQMRTISQSCKIMRLAWLTLGTIIILIGTTSCVVGIV